MAKGKCTRKEAGIKAYSEVTGEELPPRVTVAEIREYSKALPEDQRRALPRIVPSLHEYRPARVS